MGEWEVGMSVGVSVCMVSILILDLQVCIMTAQGFPLPLSTFLPENESQQRWSQQQASGPTHDTITLSCRTATP